jgi:cytochrome c oxidase assembly protein subunit 15
MGKFRKFAFLTTIATYLLIFIGGLVRVSGAGLGCPDWPTCFGRWLPPTSVDQLPPEIDPSQFNFTLAWIEYSNRMAGMLVGILVVITALLAIKHFRKEKSILYPSIAAAILIAVEGWQGSVVVLSGLEPIIVSAHMVLALIIVSLLIYATQQAYYIEYPDQALKAHYPPKTKRYLGGLWILSIIQVALGTQIRSKIEMIAAQMPMLDDVARLSKVGAINHIHMTIGIIIAVLTWIVGLNILRKGEGVARLGRHTAVWMIIVVSLQIVIGLGFVLFGMPEVIQIFHLWLASLFIGALLINYAAFRKQGSEVG